MTEDESGNPINIVLEKYLAAIVAIRNDLRKTRLERYQDNIKKLSQRASDEIA
jgi:hypothetical protein